MSIHKKIFLLLFLLKNSILTYSQKSVSGIVKDSLSGEFLIGANVDFNGHLLQSNKYGFFKINNQNNQIYLKISFVGYQSIKFNASISKDTLLVFYLKPINNQLDEVSVKSENENMFHDNNSGTFKLPVSIIKKAPSFLGESDILKTIQTLPGVSSGTEGTVGLNVRGGSAEQNLILLDGIPVYNINHLFGFFSIFNTDAVSNIDFFKGNIPARYSGRASSVLDITMKEGNTKSWTGNVGIGPITSKALIEGPIIKDKMSFLFSYRRTWLDILPRLIKGGNNTIPTYKFYDLSTKLNYKINSKNSIFLSYYTGIDKYKITTFDDETETSFSFNWGNETLNARLASIINKNLFSNLAIYYTKYNFEVQNQIKSPNNNFINNVSSNILDLGLKWEIDKYLKTSQAKFGVGLVKHEFNPNITQISGSEIAPYFSNNQTENVLEVNGFYEQALNFNNFKADIGINQINYQVDKKWYPNIEPRLSLNYKLNSHTSLKASYNYLTQFLHLLTNSSLSLPTDLWVPITDKIKPLKSHNYSLGYYKSIKNNSFQLIVEGYYRSMNNLLEYSEGASFLNNPSAKWYEKVSIGKGNSYGLEVFLRKTTGKSKGWLSYTLSWTNRQFNDINRGAIFPFKYDRRHNLNVIFLHDFSKDRQFSANFSLNSGSVITLPTGKFQSIAPPIISTNPNTYQNYTYFFDQINNIPLRNNFRMPIYHRLDLSYRVSKSKKKGQRTWSLNVYNVYSKRNAFFIYYDKGQLKQFTLFPIIPSINYEFSFK
jgi:hypothetical protein